MHTRQFFCAGASRACPCYLRQSPSEPQAVTSITCHAPVPFASPAAAEVARRHQLQFPEHGAISLRHLAAPMPLDAAHPQGPAAVSAGPAFFPAFDGDRIVGGCFRRPAALAAEFRSGPSSAWLHLLYTAFVPHLNPQPPTLPPPSATDVLPNGAGVMRAECEPTRGQKRGREPAAPGSGAAAAASPAKQDQQPKAQGGVAAAAAEKQAPATEGPQRKRRRRGSNGERGVSPHAVRRDVATCIEQMRLLPLKLACEGGAGLAGPTHS